MELQYYGLNCVRISSKKAAIVIDDNVAAYGGKPVMKPGDISLFTTAVGERKPGAKIVIDQPGEYEVSDVSVHGIAARGHMDEAGQHTATIYRIAFDDMSVAVVGHIQPQLSDEQLEAIGVVDVLIIPVGGYGFSLEPTEAIKVIRAIEPKLVIPTHYADSSIKFEVPQFSLADALAALGMEPKETVPKLKLKVGELGEVTQLVVLERQ